MYAKELENTVPEKPKNDRMEEEIEWLRDMHERLTRFFWAMS